MRCHYEVLDVARDAEASAIRKAYHRAALQHHPDKSTAADAEERFREVQAAYEILSVPAERAWYDGHRDSILRDDDGGNGAGTAPDDEFSLFAFFRTSAYSGFGSGSGSFYGVYGDVFARLSSQEARAAAAAGRAYSPPPPMGGPDTPYAPSVASFYDAWLSFATLKDFSWCDEHNPAQAPGRKIRRLMEEENRRARRAAAREHSDGVRQLAAFCRARDPRVREHARAAEAEAARRTAEAAARRAAEKAAKAAKVAAFREAEWLAGEGEAEPQWMQDELDALAAAREGAGGGQGGDGEGGEGLYCAVCSKRFRTEAQWANHERSRKHIDALALLRAQLEDEERRAGGEAGGSDGDEAAAGGSAAESSDDEAAGRGAKGGTRAARKKAAKAAKRMGRAQARAAPGDSDSDGEEAGDYDAGSLAAELASKARVASPEDKAAASGDDSDGGDEADLLRFAARTRRAAPEEAASGGDSGSGSESDESDADDADAAPPEAPVEAPAAAPLAAAGKKARRANKGSKGPAAEDAPAAPPRPLGKRGLKAAARRAGGGSAKAAPQPAIPETGTACALCGAEHESRSALFRHLRAAHSLRS